LAVGEGRGRETFSGYFHGNSKFNFSPLGGEWE
jgi:hypothetical protein